MIHRSIDRAARCTSSLILLFSLSLFFATGIAFAAAIGDQVELKATHQAGVPFHNVPGGTPQFERVPTGTVAAVIGIDRGGSWLQLRLPDARTGWISSRYVARTIAGSPPPETSAERTVWTSPEGCQQVVASGGRMTPANPAMLRVGGVSANRVHGFGRVMLQSDRRPAGVSGSPRRPGRGALGGW
jgi:hypothetical protein